MSLDPFDPVLDRTVSIDYDDLAPHMRNRLGNGEIFFAVDGATDLHDLFWPWADAYYVRHVRMRLTDLHDDEFTPLVTQFYPGYQETIIGTEGIIVTKRLAPPFKSSYDRAVMWLLECQAEGDRLLRIDVHIDWGEPLSQRLVDGLLVAQHNPQSAQGIYQQKNADSTRVFGNPHARPDHAELDDSTGAHLVYHVLVNGHVEVPFLMTISDVGEQVAWNGFLAQRDCERTFELTVREWDALLKRGRLWTPHPPLNHAVRLARIAAVRNTQRYRTGIAASDRNVIHTRQLVDVFDVCDPVQSHNLLAQLQRLAQRADGRVPAQVPLHPRDPLPDPGDAFVATAEAYVLALDAHLTHHGDNGLLDAHAAGVRSTVNALVNAGAAGQLDAEPARIGAVLAVAARLAERAGWSADGARWASEAERVGAREMSAPRAWDVGEFATTVSRRRADLLADQTMSGELVDALAPAASSAFIWSSHGLGLTRRPDGRFAVSASACTADTWWALIDFPYETDQRLTMVWDGTTLHTTGRVEAPAPITVHTAVLVHNSDELNFDLQFEFVDHEDGERKSQYFRPYFETDSATQL